MTSDSLDSRPRTPAVAVRRDASSAGGWARGHALLQLAGCALAALTSGVLLVAPTYTRQSESSTGVVSVEHLSLWQVDGLGALVPLLVPVLLAVIPLLDRQRPLSRAHLVASIVATALLAGFVLVAGLSIGLFYLPVVFCELMALGALGMARQAEPTRRDDHPAHG